MTFIVDFDNILPEDEIKSLLLKNLALSMVMLQVPIGVSDEEFDKRNVDVYNFVHEFSHNTNEDIIALTKKYTETNDLRWELLDNG